MVYLNYAKNILNYQLSKLSLRRLKENLSLVKSILLEDKDFLTLF